MEVEKRMKTGWWKRGQGEGRVKEDEERVRRREGRTLLK